MRLLIQVTRTIPTPWSGNGRVEVALYRARPMTQWGSVAPLDLGSLCVQEVSCVSGCFPGFGTIWNSRHLDPWDPIPPMDD